MSDWVVWSILAGALVILEMFTGTFYLLMFAVGMAAGGAAAWLGLGLLAQIIIAAVVCVAATVALRRTRFGRKEDKVRARMDPNVVLDIGRMLDVPAWQTRAGVHTARIRYRGADWDVQLDEKEKAVPVAGMFVITEVRGNTLIVRNREGA